MTARHGNILVRCPACGRLSLVPNTGRKRWKCPCTPKQSRFVQKDALKDQKHLTLERGVTVFAGREYPVLSECRQLEEVTIKGYDRIAGSAFWRCRHLRAVRLSDGITQIGRCAFGFCDALEKIDLPGSLTEIGDSAFDYCTALEKIDLPSDLTRIGDNAFYGCSALKKIDLPGSLTGIGNGIFTNCTALKRIGLPDSLTEISKDMFSGCTALEKIDLPESLTRIGGYAFAYSGLREVVLPERLQQLGDSAFYQCEHLDKVEIPPKLLVGLQLGSVFDDTPFYKRHYEGVWQFLPDGGVEMEAPLREFVQLADRWPSPIFLHCEIDPDFSGPAGPDERRQMEESLQKIVTLAPWGSSRIPAWQFCGCSNLKRLILPWYLERIEEGAFAHCTALEELVIPESVTAIEPKAFWGCSSLRHVRMAEPLLKTLDGSTFDGTPFWQDPALRRRACRRSDALLVFLGDSVYNTAAALCKRMNCRQDMLLLGALPGHSDDCEGAILDMPGPDVEKPRFYTIGMRRAFFYAGGSPKWNSPEWWVQALQKAKDEICALLRRYGHVVVVSNPAGNAGAGLALLAQWLRKMELSHTIIAGVPFAFEGKRKLESAQNALNDLQGSPLIEVSYEEVKRRTEDAGMNVTLINAFFELADQEVCRRLEQLLAQNGLQ